ncbi:hypothetical protein [Paraburkholderia ginsengiterrae]|uniref:hypothetical protein n=1 Tax=Paraburkholderia ginsengiterrae TaxID=1462993 RepID=UPI000A7A0998|nr:hypothetical protein [Paraburkholderia ginsengiterrae]
MRKIIVPPLSAWLIPSSILFARPDRTSSSRIMDGIDHVILVPSSALLFFSLDFILLPLERPDFF